MFSKTLFNNQTKYWVLALALFIAYGCSTSNKPKVSRGFYTPPGAFEESKPKPKALQDFSNSKTPAQVGMASWYGPGFHGKKTANGEVYNQNDQTAAHRILPLGTMVKVTNLENGRTTVVRINDRGPYVDDRILDLSHKAAVDLDTLDDGVVKVKVEVVSFPAEFDPKKGLRPYTQVIVQLGVFINQNSAQKYQQQLSFNYPTYPFAIEKVENHYRVFAGPYDERQNAEKLALILKQNDVQHLVRSYQK